MSHFNYELNERNLRLQLSKLEVPAREDAWQRFERFSESQPSHVTESKFNFRIVMNRNILLPAVFGVVIISFSLLLFNFISIKGHKKADSAQKAEIATASILPAVATTISKKEEPKVEMVSASQSPAEPRLEPVPQKAEPQMPAKQNLSPANTVASHPTQEGPVEAQTSVPLSQNPISAQPEQTIQTGDNTLNAAVNTEPVKKKRRKRAEATEELSDIRPSIVTEESDPEVRPN